MIFLFRFYAYFIDYLDMISRDIWTSIFCLFRRQFTVDSDAIFYCFGLRSSVYFNAIHCLFGRQFSVDFVLLQAL
jgi:hypothetical protein